MTLNFICFVTEVNGCKQGGNRTYESVLVHEKQFCVSVMIFSTQLYRTCVKTSISVIQKVHFFIVCEVEEISVLLLYKFFF